MLFNSYAFIFGFLPLALAAFWLAGRFGRDAALLALILASIAFYAFWRPFNVVLMAPSVALNYLIARQLQRDAEARPGRARALLLAGIAFNVAFLGYFKYLAFGETVVNDVFGAGLILTRVILPLGISFITFQKIAFLIDVQAGRIERFTLRDYVLFVLFFPQLIAGPIVHYREMMPQFHAAPCRFRAEDTAVGISLFSFGLFKKVVLADPIATYVSPIYAATAAGHPPGLFGAWFAALGFTLQVYFDFSGYTDMALGLARLFGMQLPPNFNSPLRASNIVDFWLRWHMTLTRFLTAYIYNPLSLALTRRRVARGKRVLGGRNPSWSAFPTLLMFPTVLTMFISGLWHGAGYTFILWGLLHGVYLVINHAWRLLRPRLFPDPKRYARWARGAGFAVTFPAVVISMVMFRAPSVAAALAIWHGMTGAGGATIPAVVLHGLGTLGAAIGALGIGASTASGAIFVHGWLWLAAGLAIALGAPNTLQILADHGPALGVKPAPGRRVIWRPSAGWAVALAAVAGVGILSLGQLTAFIYWQF